MAPTLNLLRNHQDGTPVPADMLHRMVLAHDLSLQPLQVRISLLNLQGPHPHGIVLDLRKLHALKVLEV